MPTRKVADVIKNQTILTLAPDSSVRAAAQAMAKNRVGSVIVIAGGKLVGIFTERDGLFRVLAAGLDPETATLAQVMTTNVATIGADAPLVRALHMMHDAGFRHMPVVDTDGRPIGMVSIRDALGTELQHFERQVKDKQALEEILG